MNPYNGDTSAGPPAASRQYARTRKSRLKAYCRPLVALALVAGMLYAIKGTTPGGWSVIGLALLIITTGTWATYGVLNASNESFALGPDWLEHTTYTSYRLYTQEEIDSFETVSGDLVFIHFKNSDDAFISFDDGIERSEEIKQWLADRYQDRQKVKQAQTAAQEQAAQSAVQALPELGSTFLGRTLALKRLHRLAGTLNVAGFLTFFCIWLPPEASDWALMAGLLLPLATVGALWHYPTLLRLDGDKQNGHPGVISAFLAPSMGLLLAQFSTNVLSYKHLWPLAGAATLATAGLLVAGSRRFLWRPKPAVGLGLLILPLAALYGFSASAVVNRQYDKADARQFTVRVLERQESKGRYQNAYYLTTERWGSYSGTNKPKVSYRIYLRTEQDSLVHIALHPGLFEVPWYEVAVD